MNMKYMILSGYDKSNLENLVNSKISQGWKPQGGVTTSVKPEKSLSGQPYYDTWFHQAMIKEQNDK